MADRRVAVLVPNLFLRAPVDAAILGAGAVGVGVAGPDDPRISGCGAIVADVDALGEDPAGAAARLAARGIPVLAFGPHVEGDKLAAVRRAGATVLPRGVFLSRLPELLASALGSSPDRS